MTTTVGHVELLHASEKFRQWRKVELEDLDFDNLHMMEEKLAPDELAEMWGVSTGTIRSIFREEEGVLKKIGKTGSKYKRGYITMQIPEGVARRVRKRL